MTAEDDKHLIIISGLQAINYKRGRRNHYWSPEDCSRTELFEYSSSFISLSLNFICWMVLMMVWQWKPAIRERDSQNPVIKIPIDLIQLLQMEHTKLSFCAYSRLVEAHNCHSDRRETEIQTEKTETTSKTKFEYPSVFLRKLRTKCYKMENLQTAMNTKTGKQKFFFGKKTEKITKTAETKIPMSPLSNRLLFYWIF